MRGRKPKPTELKRLAGNPGQRPLNDREPQPLRLTRAPRAPSYLTLEAKRAWREFARELIACGLLTVMDKPLLELYAQAVGINRQAYGKLMEMGLLGVTGKGTLMAHPLWRIVRDTQEIIRKIAIEFGAGPSARSRIKVEPVAKELSLDDKLFSEAMAKLEDGQ